MLTDKQLTDLEFKKLFHEVVVRFNTSPKVYEKADYAMLLRLLAHIYDETLILDGLIISTAAAAKFNYISSLKGTFTDSSLTTIKDSVKEEKEIDNDSLLFVTCGPEDKEWGNAYQEGSTWIWINGKIYASDDLYDSLKDLDARVGKTVGGIDAGMSLDEILAMTNGNMSLVLDLILFPNINPVVTITLVPNSDPYKISFNYKISCTSDPLKSYEIYINGDKVESGDLSGASATGSYTYTSSTCSLTGYSINVVVKAFSTCTNPYKSEGSKSVTLTSIAATHATVLTLMTLSGLDADTALYSVTLGYSVTAGTAKNAVGKIKYKKTTDTDWAEASEQTVINNIPYNILYEVQAFVTDDTGEYSGNKVTSINQYDPYKITTVILQGVQDGNTIPIIIKANTDHVGNTNITSIVINYGSTRSLGTTLTLSSITGSFTTSILVGETIYAEVVIKDCAGQKEISGGVKSSSVAAKSSSVTLLVGTPALTDASTGKCKVSATASPTLGNTVVTSVVLCYSSNSNVAKEFNPVTMTKQSDGKYKCDVTGLDIDTTYYFKVYLTDGTGDLQSSVVNKTLKHTEYKVGLSQSNVSANSTNYGTFSATLTPSITSYGNLGIKSIELMQDGSKVKDFTEDNLIAYTESTLAIGTSYVYKLILTDSKDNKYESAAQTVSLAKTNSTVKATITNGEIDAATGTYSVTLGLQSVTTGNTPVTLYSINYGGSSALGTSCTLDSVGATKEIHSIPLNSTYYAQATCTDGSGAHIQTGTTSLKGPMHEAHVVSISDTSAAPSDDGTKFSFSGKVTYIGGNTNKDSLSVFVYTTNSHTGTIIASAPVNEDGTFTVAGLPSGSTYYCFAKLLDKYQKNTSSTYTWSTAVTASYAIGAPTLELSYGDVTYDEYGKAESTITYCVTQGTLKIKSVKLYCNQGAAATANSTNCDISENYGTYTLTSSSAVTTATNFLALLVVTDVSGQSHTKTTDVTVSKIAGPSISNVTLDQGSSTSKKLKITWTETAGKTAIASRTVTFNDNAVTISSGDMVTGQIGINKVSVKITDKAGQSVSGSASKILANSTGICSITENKTNDTLTFNKTINNKDVEAKTETFSYKVGNNDAVTVTSGYQYNYSTDNTWGLNVVLTLTGTDDEGTTVYSDSTSITIENPIPTITIQVATPSYGVLKPTVTTNINGGSSISLTILKYSTSGQASENSGSNFTSGLELNVEEGATGYFYGKVVNESGQYGECSVYATATALKVTPQIVFLFSPSPYPTLSLRAYSVINDLKSNTQTLQYYKDITGAGLYDYTFTSDLALAGYLSAYVTTNEYKITEILDSSGVAMNSQLTNSGYWYSIRTDQVDFKNIKIQCRIEKNQ